MTPSFRLRLDIEDAPSEADVEVLPNGLEAFNESRWPGHQPWRPLAVFARDRGAHRRRARRAKPTPAGCSSAICGSATRCAARGSDGSSWAAPRAVRLERGCHSAWVDTFSFQAPGFYRKLGYEVFGELDYPPGHKRFFLRKRLTDGAPREGG